MTENTAHIIGAGPAGLTAAYEMLHNTNIKPIVIEMTGDIGGISRTVNYKGNRIDIGGHRFFSKSERVLKWWKEILPLQGAPSRDDILLNRKIPLSAEPGGRDPEKTDRVMLIRTRVSRIYFLRKFFDYPISISTRTFSNLGLLNTIRIGLSFLASQAFPRSPEKNLEDFFINRFGKDLYLTFFKDYTEKVWGTACDKIKPEWGAQRIKGLSVSKALMDAAKSLLSRTASIEQKEVETSLIKQYMYPKYGPGHLWEEAAARIKEMGGRIHLNQRANGFTLKDSSIVEMKTLDELTGEEITHKTDYILSSMPVKDLISSITTGVPAEVGNLASGLLYRDFLTVGLLLKKLKIRNETKIKTLHNLIPDVWIYIQEKEVKLGRLQIFNNWSPYMIKDEALVWIGLEYFCNEGDELWCKGDEEMSRFAAKELALIDIIEEEDVLDSVVIRMPKTYPAYFGSYDRFSTIRAFTDSIENLFLIGRNGMHRYNNMDHSMLTAMRAVDNIKEGIREKNNIWEINTESDYQEESKGK
jgi:protoporphyrinogen oxidase